MQVSQPAEEHRVAVVRVELGSPETNNLLVVMLEVGRNANSDRLLGTAATPAAAAALLYRWLAEMASE